jgi:D-alanyl-D-alanine-carboxypeptidase/D-alanyl-D-alanine-endopeptidase
MMNRIKGISFCFACLVSFVIAIPAHSNDRSQTPNDVFKEIETVINAAIEKHNFPSITIAILRNESIVYARGFGYADRRQQKKATENTVYQIGSTTKTFTGNILAQMIVEKRISLDDPIDKFLPKGLKFPADSGGGSIPLKHLATHSAEFPRYPANLERTDGEPILGFSKQQLYRGVELVKIDAPAGRRFFYSNFGYGVLGTALENLTSKSLDELFRQRIFEPLKMKNSSLHLNEKIKANLATPYRDDDPHQETKPWDMGAMSGAGNIFSTVIDLSLFMKEMLKDTELNRVQQKPYFKIDEASSYGLGCFIVQSKTKNTRVIHHGGDIDGYASYFLMYPEYKAGLVLLTNLGMGRVFSEVAEGVNQIIFNQLLKRGS